jgi:cytochrome P450
MSQPIPQPKGVPILGNIFDVDPSNTWWSLKKLAEEHGEIFQIKVLGKKIVFVASAALAEEICDETRFRKFVGGPIVEIRYAVHDALFTAYDDEPSWGIAHRIVAPKLSPQAMELHFEDMRSTTEELIDLWKGGDSGERLLLDDLNRLNLEATTLALYGNKLNCLTGPEHPMIKAMEDSTSEAVRRPNRPGILNWLVHGGKFRSATRAMRSYAADMVAHRRTNPTDRQDVLAALMGGKDTETGAGLSESQVLDEVVSMPIGSSTAPCLITAAVLFLARNPDALAKARRELDSVVGAGPLTRGHLDQLSYVEAVMRETLRLASPAPGFNIEPIPRDNGNTQPVTLGGGRYEIAHNQALVIVLSGVNRDPAVFEDPLEFRPERMLGAGFEKLPAGAKKWFGNGKRECIGKHYAWQWNMVVLALLIKEVDFEMADPGYELVQDGWFNVRPRDFWVKVKARAA